MSEIKNFLANQKGQQGDQNLYDHLSNVLAKMLLENPTNAYDVLEEFSHDVKFSGQNYKKDMNFDHKPRMRETYTEIKEWADKASVTLEVEFHFIHLMKLSTSFFRKKLISIETQCWN